VTLAVTAAGCSTGGWLQARNGDRRTGDNPSETTITAANVAGLDVAWTAHVTGRPTEAMVDGNAVYVHPTDGSVYSFDLGDGHQRWKSDRTLIGDSVPAVANDQLYALGDGRGTSRCLVASFDLATGAEKLAFEFGHALRPDIYPPAGQACYADDALVSDGKLVAQTQWLFNSRHPCNLIYPIYHGIEGWRLDVFAIGEPPNWVLDPPSQDGCIGGSPWSAARALVSGDQVIRMTWSAFEAYPLSDCGGGTIGACTATWSAPDDTFQLPLVLANGDLVTAPPTHGGISVLDATTHTTEWTTSIPQSVGGLAASDTTIFVTGSDGTRGFPAEGCGAATCAPLWSGPNSSGYFPTIGGDVLYVGSQDGTVTALPANGCGAATCGALWSASTGSQITGAPVVTNGTVIVGSADGTVTAYRLPS
jgi:outer membrane protein assembly factor BamB